MDSINPNRKRKADEPEPDIEHPKRPRIDIRPAYDIHDIGIVVESSDPGPSTGTLPRRGHPEPLSPAVPPHRPPKPDFASPLIPPPTPLINRHTLRELDLDVIIRNPVLRHDLLFDAGLQFRPRRKRETSEKYWAAVWEEVKSGCTCLTLDTHGKLHRTVCMCPESPAPPPAPVAFFISSDRYTVRMPSRILPLLTEFLEVMLFVIQPLSNTNVYSNPHDVKEQAREHSAHAAHLRDIFDPALIYQELTHNVFDPKGIFLHIGDTLKSHCAPMRDRAVHDLVQLAQQPGPVAFKAFRSCLELLELMKLDIANHQIAQLRPWLARNTGAFEIKAFKMRFGAEPSLHHTREWLSAAHDKLSEGPKGKGRCITHPAYPENEFFYGSMTRNQQVFVATLRGIVDIVYDGWLKTTPRSMLSSASRHPPLSSIVPPAPASSSPTSLCKPETLYLDRSRIAHFFNESADVTALYMLMLLFRQLLFVDLGAGATTRPVNVKSVAEEELLALRKELAAIHSDSLDICFLPPEGTESENLTDKEKKELAHRRSVRLDLVLQVAKRAWDRRRGGAQLSTSTLTGITSDVPEQRLLDVATRWADKNMHRNSPLTLLLHNRMREVTFDLVVSLAFPLRESLPSVHASAATAACASTPPSPSSSSPTSALPNPFTSSTTAAAFGTDCKIDLYHSTRALHSAEATTDNYSVGMEGVMDDARSFAEKVAKLSLIHLNTFLGMYECELGEGPREVSVKVEEDGMEGAAKAKAEEEEAEEEEGATMEVVQPKQTREIVG